jgi:hypothetical protein
MTDDEGSFAHDIRCSGVDLLANEYGQYALPAVSSAIAHAGHFEHEAGIGIWQLGGLGHGFLAAHLVYWKVLVAVVGAKVFVISIFSIKVVASGTATGSLSAEYSSWFDEWLKSIAATLFGALCDDV